MKFAKSITLNCLVVHAMRLLAICFSTVGRRIAELEIHTTLAQIIRSLCVQYTDPKPMDYIMKGVLVPERQLNLVFTDC